MLELSEYRELIRLDEPFVRAHPPGAERGVAQPESRLAEQLVEELVDRFGAEQRALSWLRRPDLSPRQRLYALLISRDPSPFPAQTLDSIDRLWAIEAQARRVVSHTSLPRGVSLWKGDIAELSVDAIVNAANDALLGCFRPFHACIDNRIHAVAGPRLRADCKQIMDRQGHLEPTGKAKITRAYFLPSQFVLHTVGPIVADGSTVSDSQCEQLANCYKSCLDLAAQVPQIRSLALCCISTGAFGFPQALAADIAIHTVEKWQKQSPTRFERIVFNVFTEMDHALYAGKLAQRSVSV